MTTEESSNTLCAAISSIRVLQLLWHRFVRSLLVIRFLHYVILVSQFTIWVATWQNQQNECAPNEDSDQPGHPPSLIKVFALRSLGPKVSSCGQRRLWSDWADAQADLGLRWVHSHFVGFSCRGSYQVTIVLYLSGITVSRKQVLIKLITLWTRNGVYETLFQKHMPTCKDNLETRCQSQRRGIIQSNIYKNLPKVNQVIYTIGTVCVPNITILAPSNGPPDILLIRSYRFTMHKSEKGDTSAKYL